jgi:putative transposase
MTEATGLETDAHTTTISVQSLTEASDLTEVQRHALGSDRFEVVKRYWDGDLTPEEGSDALGISRSQFFRICAKARGALNYLQVVPGKRGRKADKIVLPYEVERMIEEIYIEHYPQGKTFSAVWEACQVEGDRRRITRPSYYSVCRWIKQRPERERYEMVNGEEAAAQRYDYRPGYKETSRPLEWVQIDHTPADLLVVDSLDRTTIIGRPYLSFAICIHTRVVLGFYISFLHPSAVTVAKLLETCVLPKNKLLEAWKLRSDLWPMHGLPEVIHTDNAKEFVSQVFQLNAKDFDIDVQQRPIGKKHFGGHIESLIGKQSMKLLHALPGTTGANTVARKKLKSEKSACVTIERLRRLVALGIHSYHETKHSELNDRPARIWEKFQATKNAPRMLLESKHDSFRYCFYPEVPRKKITTGGIELFRRFYDHADFESSVLEEVLVKYDPYDISYIMVFLHGKWIKATCKRNVFERSNDYELYRWERQQKGERNGTMSAAGAESKGQIFDEVKEEKSLTAQAKRKRKRVKGEEDYRKENKLLDKAGNKPESHAPENKKTSAELKPKAKKEIARSKSDVKSNVIDLNAIMSKKLTNETDDEIVIYNMDRF